MIVTNINFLKNESNSQLLTKEQLTDAYCYKYQFFKERKQFTTYVNPDFGTKPLLQISIF